MNGFSNHSDKDELLRLLLDGPTVMRHRLDKRKTSFAGMVLVSWKSRPQFVPNTVRANGSAQWKYRNETKPGLSSIPIINQPITPQRPLHPDRSP
ncbi:MAG: hypothetical protein LZF62_140018 [Nitrospira sp.]|nr:MAG: hypothetical protein LZF62_140018 [Nitrospira sp.]